MRYLKHKDDFLKNTEFLKEVFENDITWGGSLLGRLINSTIRKAKIGYNYTKVNSIVKQVEDQINNLYSYYANEEDKSKISDLVSRFLIEEVYKVSNSDQEIEKKLDILLGNKSTESLIDTTIGEVNKTSIDGKEDLIEKLKKFKEDLLKLRQELGLTEGEGESEEEVENPSDGKEEDKVKVFYMNSKSLLESICKIHRDIKNNTVKFQSGVSDQIKVGNTYLYTNSNGKTNKVKVISLTNVVDDGKDDAFLTPDDVKQKQIEKGYVSVTILDGNDHSNPTVAVNPKLLKKAPENTSSTFFDDEKYKKQRTNTESEIKQKIELAKKGLSVYKASQSKERINFYNNEINKLTNLLNTKFNKKVSKSPVTVTSNESFILEEVDAHMRDQESDAKMAWNKVVNAYNKSGIVKYIPYIESIIKIEGADKEKIVKNKKSIMNIGRQVVINYDNVGKPMSYQELISEQEGFSTSDVAKSISLFGRVLLAFSEDMGLLGSYGASYKAEGDAGGAGNHIKLFIKSFNSIKEAYPLLKKESNSFSSLLRYQYFKMIREAQDDVEDNISIDEPESISKENPETGSTDTEQTEEKETTDVEVDAVDKVKKSWFKFFKKDEEKKWKVDEKVAKDLNSELENKPVEIDTQKIGDSNLDPIIRIVNLFGKAYDLYATDYIPSGRPEGRVSQRTLREYENIGKGGNPQASGRDAFTPGYGPWAAKVVYSKWQDGITKILENKQYRRILANAKFVSEAEKSTDTEMKKPGSGKTLFTFINDLLDNNEGTFKKHRKVIFEKYFMTDPSGGKEDGKPIGEGNKRPNIREEDKGETDKPYFYDESVKITTGIMSLGKGLLNTMIKVTSGDSIYIIHPFKYVEKNKVPESVLFRYQVFRKNNPKQSIVSDYLKTQKSKSSDTKGKPYNLEYIEKDIPYSRDSVIGIGYIDLTDKSNKFSNGNVFKFKSISIRDAVEKKFNTKKDVSKKITDIKYLVVPVNDEKGKQKVDLVKFSNVSVTNGNDRKLNPSINDEIINGLK